MVSFNTYSHMSTVRIYKGAWLQIILANYDDIYLV